MIARRVVVGGTKTSMTRLDMARVRMYERLLDTDHELLALRRIGRAPDSESGR